MLNIPRETLRLLHSITAMARQGTYLMASISKCRAEATGEPPSLHRHVPSQEIALLLPKHSMPGDAGVVDQVYSEAVKIRE